MGELGFMRFTIWIENKCNMRCKYCYEQDTTGYGFQEKIVSSKEIVSFIKETAKSSQISNLLFRFHGGEPLLNPNRILDLFDLFEKELNEYSIHTTLTTNGTLLGKKKSIQVLDKMSSFSISLDGEKKYHDLNRKLLSGKSSYDIVIKNIKKLSKQHKNKASIRMSVDSVSCENLFNNLKFIEKIGLKEVVVGFVYSDKNWTNYSLKKLWENMERSKIEYTNSNMIISFLQKKKIRQSFCNGGISSFDISINGDLYPCTYISGDERFKIGNIFNGITDKLIPIRESYTQTNSICQGCTYNKFCITHRCKIINKALTGDFLIPNPVMCNIEQMLYEIQK